MWLLESLDLFLLDRVERFCHWFQQLTGRTNQFLAKVAMVVYFVSTSYEILVRSTALGGMNLELAWEYFAVAIGVYYMVYFYESEYKTIRRLSSGVSNPLKINPMFKIARIIVCAGVLLQMGSVVVNILYFLLTSTMRRRLSWNDWYIPLQFWSISAWLYLISCDSLPPRAGKIKDFLSKFFGQPVPTHN